MTDIAIRVDNLGKKYKLGGQKSGDFRESINRWFQRNRQVSVSGFQSPDSPKDFWALKDVSFEIKQGEAVGIIGRNGAGKSTLLKILSRITEPTKGRFEIFGRVSSLLEVGTGFHEDLTGRENIYLNGTILGMRRAEIKAKFDEIVDFSGVGKFIDTPVKHYSSGMKVRLAFSVAAHLEPEILIIDEVLAVGDAEFQKKCLGKMEDVTQNNGRTVLFVSHNMGAVQSLCSRGIFLKNGSINLDEATSQVIKQYMKDYSVSETIGTADKSTLFTSLKDDYLEFIEIDIRQDEELTTNLQNSKEVIVCLKYQVRKQISALQIFIDLYDMSENLIFRTFHFENQNVLVNMPPLTKKGIYLSTAKIPSDLLVEGSYKLIVRAANMYERMIEPKEGVLFNIVVEETGKYARQIYQAQKGLVTPSIVWSTEVISNIVV